MTFRNLIVLIAGILILTSLKVVEGKPNKLSVKVEVKKSLGNHRVNVFIETGTPDYELLLLNNSSKRHMKSSERACFFDKVSRGDYSLAVQDSEGHYFLGKVVVD